MNDYYRVRIDVCPCSEDVTDVMAALLAEVDYESFEPDTEGLTAYVRAADFDEDRLAEALEALPFEGHTVSMSHEFVEGRDWNAEWERNYFKPIVIDGQLAIHSSFHTDIPECRYDIVIDPKMAFGTGHHATTSQVTRALLSMALEGKSLIDMGTGTGILAILSRMRGAGPVTAIEIDEFAVVNARENVALNGCPDIRVIHGDASSLADVAPADVFVANINRNIITGDMHRYVKALRVGGTMLLSGFYERDIEVIMEVARPLGLEYVSHTVESEWSCLRLRRAE